MLPMQYASIRGLSMLQLRKNYFISKDVMHISSCWLKKIYTRVYFHQQSKNPIAGLFLPVLCCQHHFPHLLSVSPAPYTHTCIFSSLHFQTSPDQTLQPCSSPFPEPIACWFHTLTLVILFHKDMAFIFLHLEKTRSVCLALTGILAQQWTHSPSIATIILMYKITARKNLQLWNRVKILKDRCFQNRSSYMIIT